MLYGLSACRGLCSFVPEPTEEDLALQAAEATGGVAAIAAPPPAEGAVVEELSGDSDGFEDLGKDTDAIQLRQRRAATASAAGGVDTAAAADAAPAADAAGKKGQ
jgi:hypothetical protein